MAHITRQELKSDEFVSGMDAAYEFYLQHRERLVKAGVAVVVLLALGWGGLVWWQHHTVAANAALAGALDTLHSPLANAGPPTGTPEFASVEARANAAAGQFHQVMDQYGSTTAAQWAQYYLGLAQVDQNNLGGAEKSLRAASGARDKDVAATAKNALANFYLRKGDTTQARTLLLQLANQNSPVLPPAVAWMELANLDQATNPAEAAEYYKKLQAAFPDTPTAKQAGDALAAMGKH